jgi:hypothetical protein
MALKKSNGLVTILSTSNSAIISVAKSILEDAAIEYIIKSDGHENIPADNITSPAEIQVNYAKEMDARKLLADLEDIKFEE